MMLNEVIGSRGGADILKTKSPAVKTGRARKTTLDIFSHEFARPSRRNVDRETAASTQKSRLKDKHALGASF
jgi:hypothetical protein